MLALLASAPALCVARLQGAGAGAPQVSLKVGQPGGAENMAYLLSFLDRFHSFAAGGRQGVLERLAVEDKSLEEAAMQAQDPAVKAALEQSMVANRRSAEETERVYENLLNFSGSMGSLLRTATAVGQGCLDVSCGPHSSCTVTAAGAECICNEGYVGFARERNCRPPPEFVPHSLLLQGSGSAGTQVAELDVTVFQANKIAVVFRELSEGTGRVIVGRVHDAGTASVSAPAQFTTLAGRAFSPIVTGTEDGRILIAWRDENKMATCWMRGAALGAEGVQGDFALTMGTAVNFCSDQAHKMAAVHLTNSKVALLFSDKVRETRFTPAESFGNSLLVQVGARGDLQVLGRYRFADYPVCRLETTKISPTAFVVGTRAGAAVDDSDTVVATKQEALALYGELIGNDLVFDPNTLSVAPSEDKIWARGLSLIAPNTVAYAYQHGDKETIRMAVLKVDPLSHHMSLVQKPVTLRQGMSPYVSMLSVPYTAADPHALAYYQSGNSSKINLCSWSVGEGRLHKCEEFEWMSHRLTSVAGVQLSGGKSLMVFAPESGTPYYQVFGLSKK